MHQVLTMEHGQHRQQLTQQQQHLSGAKHHLTLGPGHHQLLIGAAGLPLPHQPEGSVLTEGGTEAWHLGMQHPLEATPDRAHPLGIVAGIQPAQGDRSLCGQLIGRLPELALGTAGETLLQAIALADQLAGLAGVDGSREGSHQPAGDAGRSGCRRPLPSSQLWS